MRPNQPRFGFPAAAAPAPAPAQDNHRLSHVFTVSLLRKIPAPHDRYTAQVAHRSNSNPWALPRQAQHLLFDVTSSLWVCLQDAPQARSHVKGWGSMQQGSWGLYRHRLRQQQGQRGSGALQGSPAVWSTCTWPRHTWGPCLHAIEDLSVKHHMKRS